MNRGRGRDGTVRRRAAVNGGERIRTQDISIPRRSAPRRELHTLGQHAAQAATAAGASPGANEMGNVEKAEE